MQALSHLLFQPQCELIFRRENADRTQGTTLSEFRHLHKLLNLSLAKVLSIAKIHFDDV